MARPWQCRRYAHALDVPRHHPAQEVRATAWVADPAGLGRAQAVRRHTDDRGASHWQRPIARSLSVPAEAGGSKDRAGDASQKQQGWPGRSGLRHLRGFLRRWRGRHHAMIELYPRSPPFIVIFRICSTISYFATNGRPAREVRTGLFSIPMTAGRSRATSTIRAVGAGTPTNPCSVEPRGSPDRRKPAVPEPLLAAWEAGLSPEAGSP